MTDTARARLRGVLQQPAADDDALVFTASSTGLNRYGFALRTDGWHVDNFNNNPVVLWMHMDHMPPIGRATASVGSDRLETAITFDREDSFAANIERKYRGGFLNAVSVGFDFVDGDCKPIQQWHRMSADDIRNRAHYDLAEVSAVPVPADPQALRRQRSMLAAGLMDDMFYDIEELPTELAQLFTGLGDKPKPPQQPAAPTLPGNTELDLRVTELESGLSVLRTRLVAKPVHHTATEDSEWDGSAAVAAMPNDEATLWNTHAWRDPEGDPDAKSSYKFPHHRTSGGPANLNACRAILSGRGAQADIPEAELEAARRHAQAHLDDASDASDEAAFAPQTAADFLAAIRLQHN